MHRLPSRLAAALALVVGALMLAGVTPAAAAAPTTAPSTSLGTTADPAPAAAGWLVGQTRGKPYLAGQYGPDLGLTADLVLSLDAARVGQREAAAATDYLAANAAGYVSYNSTYYPGSLGKLALVAEAQGRDPDGFGSVRLLHQITAMECPHAGCTPSELGFYKSPDTTNGYQSVLTQALAILALQRGGDHPSAAAARWLVGQQCASGGFTVDERDTSLVCDRKDAQGNVADRSDTDSTGYVVQALVATGQRAATAKAAAYLARAAAGGFATSSVTANAAAIAAQGLTAAGSVSGAATAHAFLRRLALGCSAPAAERGAVLPNAGATYDASSPGTLDPVVRATAQAAAGLTGRPLASISATGAAAEVPTLDCTPRSPSPTPTPTPTSPTPSATPTATPSGTPTAAPPSPTATGTPGAGSTGPGGSTGPSTQGRPPAPTLPATGAGGLSATALTGLALLLMGGALLLLGRERRRHGRHAG